MAYANVLTPGMFHPGDGNNYPTHEDIYGKGGFMVTSDKENISPDRLKVGMYVHDPSVDKIYELTSKTPAIWEEVNLGGTQIPADWNQSDNTQLDFIKNKPNFQVITEDEIDAAFSGVDMDLNYIEITFTSDDSTINAYYFEDGHDGILISGSEIAVCFSTPKGVRYYVGVNSQWNGSQLYLDSAVYDGLGSVIGTISDGTEDFVITKPIPYITFTLGGANYTANRYPSGDETGYVCFSTENSDLFYILGEWYETSGSMYIEIVSGFAIYQKENGSFTEIYPTDIDYNFDVVPV